MALRIKELCKEKNTTLAEIADKIGINKVTLSQSLNGNPTLSRLQEVADILDVSVADLFEQPAKNTIYGCLYVNNKPVIVKSKADIDRVLKELE